MVLILDIDRSRSLACLSTARGTVAPTRGQVPGGVLLGTSTGWILVFSRIDPLTISSPEPLKPPGLQGPPGASGLQGYQGFSETFPGSRASEIGAFRGLRASGASETGFQAPGLGPWKLPLLTSFKLSGPSAYTNEEVLLLTKMDLTEFRS